MTTGVEAFDKTIHKTNEWFKDLMYELNWDDRRHGYRSTLAAQNRSLNT